LFWVPAAAPAMPCIPHAATTHAFAAAASQNRASTAPPSPLTGIPLLCSAHVAVAVVAVPWTRQNRRLALARWRTEQPYGSTYHAFAAVVPCHRTRTRSVLSRNVLPHYAGAFYRRTANSAFAYAVTLPTAALRYKTFTAFLGYLSFLFRRTHAPWRGSLRWRHFGLRHCDGTATAPAMLLLRHKTHLRGWAASLGAARFAYHAHI